ncbi:MAG TPA: site-2 protease family protein [Thermomicrobiaceae bacterium]|nr:site-2 protease family protein [Thermomicrobiaceae bacterium]
MTASLKLGTIRGITIGIHYTWLIIFGLLTYSLAADFFPAMYSHWSTAAYWITATLASLLLFGSVLAHELGHSLVAQSKGIPVSSITLFVFGGVATITKESQRARDEFEIAIAGPVVSLGIGLLGLLGYGLLANVSQYAAAVLAYLGLANLLLFGFNLIPGYPLDGGRVFRAFVWGVSRSVERATRLASMVGAGVGVLFIVAGIVLVFADPISGIWLVAIGWFLHSAAEQSYQQFRMARTFSGMPVSALMDEHPFVIGPSTTLDDVVENYILAHNVRGLPVIMGDRLVGIITLTDIRDVPHNEWPMRTVRERMTPTERLVTTTPDSPVETVLQAMTETDIHQVPVIDGEQLVGLLTRNSIMRYLQLRLETGVPAPTQTSQGTSQSRPSLTSPPRRAERMP